jgi:hypothetical protein
MMMMMFGESSGCVRKTSGRTLSAVVLRRPLFLGGAVARRMPTVAFFSPAQ